MENSPNSKWIYITYGDINLLTKLYRRNQACNISTTSGIPWEIFEGAVTPYKDIRLENCFRHIWINLDPIKGHLIFSKVPL